MLPSESTTMEKQTNYTILRKTPNNKKIPLIPPLFHKNCLIIGFKEKTELFNSLFSKQCSLITNHRKLPISPSYLTDKCLPKITSTKDIAKIT